MTDIEQALAEALNSARWRRLPIPRRHVHGHRYVLWPIAIGFARHTALRTLDWHGWALGDGTYGQTLHFGPIKVYLGRRRRR